MSVVFEEGVLIDEDDLSVYWVEWKKFGGIESFYDMLKNEWDMHSIDDLFLCLCDFNLHMGRHIDGFYCVHVL